MKKTRSIALAFILCISLFSGCTSTTEKSIDSAPAVIWQPGEETERTARAETMYTEIFGDMELSLYATNPDYADIINNFIYGDVYYQSDLLDLRQRELITLASLTTHQSYELLKQHAMGALNVGLTPEEVMEAVYHCTPYIGIATTYEAVIAVTETFLENDVALPESQRQVEDDDRFDSGAAVQAEHFGMNPTRGDHITEFVSAYCFGDFYTRGALDFKDRELLTMCTLANMGAPQLGGHVIGTFNAGYSKDEIIAAITQCMPYMGVPRTLSAISVVNERLPDESSDSGQENITTAVQSETTNITMTTGETVITATLDNSETTQEFLATLPRTLAMSRYADREYYGRVEPLSQNGEAIPDFSNGDVTYYSPGPSLAIFFANEDQSSLSGLIRMGKITSDLSVFDALGESMEMLVEIAE